jgi:hypothetical protein
MNTVTEDMQFEVSRWRPTLNDSFFRWIVGCQCTQVVKALMEHRKLLPWIHAHSYVHFTSDTSVLGTLSFIPTWRSLNLWCKNCECSRCMEDHFKVIHLFRNDEWISPSLTFYTCVCVSYSHVQCINHIRALGRKFRSPSCSWWIAMYTLHNSRHTLERITSAAIASCIRLNQN